MTVNVGDPQADAQATRATIDEEARRSARATAAAVLVLLSVAFVAGAVGFAIVSPALALLYVAGFALALVVALVRIGG